MSWTLVTQDSELLELLAVNAGAEAVVVDTEFMRRDTFFPQAALIQLCFVGSTEAWLIDPLAVTNLQPLAALLVNPEVVKILHSPSEDLEVFQQLLGCMPQPLFDSQKAAALLGLGFGLGYRGLIEALTGVELPKEETRSDWLRRPLSDSQLEYAAQDVVPLADLYPQMRRDLEQRGRFAWVLEDGASAISAAQADAAPAHLRVKSGWKLKQQQLSRLAALCEWREARARSSDKPRNWILHDKCCLALAERGATNFEDLKRVPDMPASVVRKQGEQLLELLEKAPRDYADPAPIPAPLTQQQRDTVKQMKRFVAELAEQWGVAPEILLSGKDYEHLVRRVAPGDKLEPPTWQGWRQQPLLNPLRAMLAEASR